MRPRVSALRTFDRENYHGATEASEATTSQMAAQNPSERSNTMVTNDVRSGPRSIEPLTVDPRSRRPLTELCCPPVSPVTGCAIRLVKQTRCRRRFPHVKKGARSRPAVFTPAPP
jgi:hypothetical protein